MLRKKLVAVLLSLFILTGSVYAARPADFHQKYQLKQVVILSRHNIRSALSTDGSALAKLTPHSWFKWTSGPSELSLLGGELETLMGQYFRKWLVAEGLMTENYIPKSGEMRFYANSMQRTLATAQYFSTGMLPVANVRIEHKYAPSRMDPVFEPRFTFMTEPYRMLLLEQTAEMAGGKLQGINEMLKEEYELLEKVLDLKDSQIAKEEGFTHFRMDDLKITSEVYKEPNMKGSLKLANQASDAFILQYYEDPDPLSAAFGHEITQQDWEKIAHVKDVYGDVLFTTPAVAAQVANPLLRQMKKELTLKKRKFAFLCGHDSNLASVLAALKAEPYELPDTIEKKTPIGSKLVLSKWVDENRNEYISFDLVYQTAEQIKNRTMLTLDTPPAVFPISLQGLAKNGDGLYKLSDVLQRFQTAIDQYKILKKLK